MQYSTESVALFLHYPCKGIEMIRSIAGRLAAASLCAVGWLLPIASLAEDPPCTPAPDRFQMGAVLLQRMGFYEYVLSAVLVDNRKDENLGGRRWLCTLGYDVNSDPQRNGLPDFECQRISDLANPGSGGYRIVGQSLQTLDPVDSASPRPNLYFILDAVTGTVRPCVDLYCRDVSFYVHDAPREEYRYDHGGGKARHP